MKKIIGIVLLCIIYIYMIGCNNVNQQSIEHKKEPTSSVITENKNTLSKENAVENISTSKKVVDYSEFFNGIDGCAVFYNSDIKEYKFYNEQLCKKQASPCSTFKIISTLVALQKGVLTSTESKMNYNGTDYPIKSWNKDLTLKEAFQTSCVWYFKKVIDKIGKDDMEKSLKKLSYGNCDVSQWNGENINPLPELNGFWLESSLKISPKEQVEVLANIFNGKTDFSKQNIAILKDIMLVNKNEHISIYGKTGTGYTDNAWFVGMLEHNTQKYFFAIHLNDKNNKNISGPTAREIALKIINRYYNN
ncbi:bla regulator protein BlaR1 [Clostridium tetanomorphum]|uniref:penicillin-binding transpeptidase domain-containing protein n=1 Tax=Clostridium tetanomorphum TaxID=1553 RepID=UPI00044C15F3|nr:penicillin-binding transpeptidase domain-containing protein [Clostridium tetanomorphum]KAJ49618.1 beta-lactamase class D [Clostridium tetanomorphum DSM 665]KAJ52449.1 beta-lactamase class D [Clostridium tetanomorphum DSM 665]MBP1864708.1 bla regulator protein BlaR1 [Clostridium tetanomorphum]NRS83886.1 bla regulator protein BlaR1 [Clostridium tetanomorphum]SQB93175.1 beta-lactamase class D [Clostridium tetanomorphum]